MHQLGDNEPLLHIQEDAADVHFESRLHLYRLQFTSVSLSSQRLAITANEPIGLVPEYTKVGDAVCAIYRSELPFILRRCSRSKFRFIGHGRFVDFDFDDAVEKKRSPHRVAGKTPIARTAS